MKKVAHKYKTDIAADLAENLTRSREMLGLTQKQLSDLTGIYQSDISKIERGIANPSVSTLKRLADGMGLKLWIDFVAITDATGVASVESMEEEFMWAYESVFYQIYPLGFCGAPFENDGKQESRILKVLDWIPHIQKLGANAIYFSPIFESDTHGYNTRDYQKIDCRLGTNEDFAKVCEELHQADIRVVLDGVFNHVGRGFWAFEDVLQNRENSRYRDWFHIDFNGNSHYNDGLWYEGWEGNFDLVKLNLQNEEVIQHIFAAVKYWVETFDIDGLRLDVAYCLDREFLKRLRQFTDTLKEDFFLVGETLHGDYKQWANDEMCHSVTNYECYHGMHSSFNSMNMFEICHSLLRQYGPEEWTLYKGMHLLNFVDNHDVSRVASVLKNEKHLPLIYALCFGMPGIPCVYYGSEWGTKADKSEGDPALRVSFDEPETSELTEWIAKLAEVKKNSKALNYGGFRSVVLTNQQCIFERKCEGERILVAINASGDPYTAHFDAGCGMAEDLLTGKDHDFGGGSELPPYSAAYWKMER
ncbi:MAG: helix-turn-helix domain-containing protein [Lachnospiraceae bacterium]|nr:helix-turn-helix domain-containing protein [Lachnospiraceae bacterium]